MASLEVNKKSNTLYLKFYDPNLGYTRRKSLGLINDDEGRKIAEKSVADYNKHSKLLHQLKIHQGKLQRFTVYNNNPQLKDNLYYKKSRNKSGSFYNWIIKQNNRTDEIGDLSCEIIKDKLFPKQSNSIDDMTNYLIMANALPTHIKSLAQAYKEFKSAQNKRKSISKSLRFKVLKENNYRCQICGASSEDDNVKLEIDHKIPVSKGGTNDIKNLWVVCFNCNRGKSTKEI